MRDVKFSHGLIISGSWCVRASVGYLVTLDSKKCYLYLVLEDGFSGAHRLCLAYKLAVTYLHLLASSHQTCLLASPVSHIRELKHLSCTQYEQNYITSSGCHANQTAVHSEESFPC